MKVFFCFVWIKLYSLWKSIWWFTRNLIGAMVLTIKHNGLPQNNRRTFSECGNRIQKCMHSHDKAQITRFIAINGEFRRFSCKLVLCNGKCFYSTHSLCAASTHSLCMRGRLWKRKKERKLGKRRMGRWIKRKFEKLNDRS